MVKLTKEQIKIRLRDKIADLEHRKAPLDAFRFPSLINSFNNTERENIKKEDFEEALEELKEEGVVVTREVNFEVYAPEKVLSKDINKELLKKSNILLLIIVISAFLFLLIPMDNITK